MSAEEHKQHAPTNIRCAVLTVSDTRDISSDTSGALLTELLEKAGFEIASRQLVSNQEELLSSTIQDLIDRQDIDVVITTGGTGLGPRDISADVVASFVEKPLPGFGELFRQLSYAEIGPASILSRALGGARGEKLLFALPGSSKAVRLALEKILIPELGHLLGELRGRRSHKHHHP